MDKVKEFFHNIGVFIKNHKKLIIIPLVLLVLIGGYFKFFRKNDMADVDLGLMDSEYTVLEKKTFSKSFNETGKIFSEKSTEIYAEKPLMVDKVLVKVGDKVKEGDILVELDKSTFEKSLEQNRTQISSTKRSVGTQVREARDKLDEAMRSQRDGTHPSLVSAEQGVTSAHDAWQAAEKEYEDFKRSLEEGYNDQLIAERDSKDSAQSSIEKAKRGLVKTEQDIDKANRAIDRNAEIYRRESERLDYMEARQEFLENRIADIQPIIENTPEYTPPSPPADLTSRLTMAQNEINIIKNLIAEKEYYLKETKIESTYNIISEEIEFLKTKLEGKEATKEDINREIDKFNEEVIANAPNEHKEIARLTSELSSLKRELTDVQAAVAESTGEVEKAKAEIDANQAAIDSLYESKDEQEYAIKDAEKAKTSLDEKSVYADKSRQDMLANLRKNADTMKNNYDAAIKNNEVAKRSVESEIKSLKNNLSMAGAGSDTALAELELKYLKEDMEAATVRAPISGTVTEVNVEEGETPEKYLLKIETVESTIIESQIKEFEINDVKPGMKVEITSESLDSEDIIDGTIDYVASTPKSETDQFGSSTSNEAVYQTKIKFDKGIPEGLRPGMSVKIKYLLEKFDKVYTVPTTAVYQKNEKFFVLAIDDKNATKTVKEIQVENISENDFEVVIDSKELKDGLIILNNPDMYYPGMEIEINQSMDMPQEDFGENLDEENN